MQRKPSRLKPSSTLPFFLLAFLFAAFFLVVQTQAQDWVRTGTNLGADKIRIAVADFKPFGNDPQAAQQIVGFKSTFDSTLFADLNNAGIFDVASKSLAPPLMPGSPSEMNVTQWSAPPANASMVAFGSISVASGRVLVNGWLFDAKNTQSPQVLGKQYSEEASDQNTRLIAHRFADEIIFRLGGGLPGIAESKIYYVAARGGNKEIWAMDYDGQGQHQITHLGTVSLSPRISPDNGRLAFASLSKDGWNIRMYSMLLDRMVGFPSFGGTNLSPAWSPDGNQLAFSSSRTGDPEIWVSDSSGGALRRITSYRGPDVSPVWNPRTGSQIAWISGRTGLPQLYIMDSDGSSVQRMTDGGYATSPSWSPNGQFMAFAWDRKYGPGAPGGQDIYVMEIATKRWIQLTHEAGRCDFPSWSPDGRHLVFESKVGSATEIWTMLADGTQRRKLTSSGGNSMPNWSWK